MKILIINVLLLLKISVGQNNYYISNEYKDKNQLTFYNEKIRTLFFFSDVGILEIFSVGVGYQFTENWSISLKGSVVGFEGGFLLPNAARGVGLKVSYNFKRPLFSFNKISLEYTAHLLANIDYIGKNLKEPFYKGSFYDLNLGHEILNESGFNLFWSVGFCINAVKYTKTLYSPSLKIGFNYNFL